MKVTVKQSSWYKETANERREALVDFVKSMQLDSNGQVKKDAIPLSQEDLLSALKDYYPNYDENRPAHDQSARLVLLSDLRAINQNEKYPFMRTVPSTMILTEEEAYKYLQRRFSQLSKAYARLGKMAKRLGRSVDDQLFNPNENE